MKNATVFAMVVMTVLLTHVWATSLGLAREASSIRPPNVILIMTDDQGYGDITSHGNLKIKTPNIDKIANTGARLDNFFVSPVCAPTRASLFTGRYHIRTGTVHVSKNLDVMRAEEMTIAEVF